MFLFNTKPKIMSMQNTYNTFILKNHQFKKILFDLF